MWSGILKAANEHNVVDFLFFGMNLSFLRTVFYVLNVFTAQIKKVMDSGIFLGSRHNAWRVSKFQKKKSNFKFSYLVLNSCESIFPCS